ncbi:Acid membrane antigen A [hydrothermal vent metagenome]|uniref:Acid membrane antigen A n=1 Tax=hydrothermal vent metagenome TaxID=652676 RepID=A0A1W1D3H3_9ZZZZ
MKSQFFVAALFVLALYWMYLLYAPFLLVITVAALLAISTSEVYHFFETWLKNRFFASLLSSILLGVLFFAPLGYFLTTLTIQLNSLDPQVFFDVKDFVKEFIKKPPQFLLFLKPYLLDWIKDLDMNSLTSYTLMVAGKIGAISAGFLKNAFLVTVFYFFALYNGRVISNYIKQAVQISVNETAIVVKELSSVMSVVFYSILVNAMFQGTLFGLAIAFMGYNGLLFGIMYGFTSLLPVVGGALMWLPFMLYLFSIGQSNFAIFIALYSIIVISIIADTFIKPFIIKEINTWLLKDEDAKMDELVIFFAIIAGLTTFGFWGMILGPAITTFFLTILKLFAARSQEANSHLE